MPGKTLLICDSFAYRWFKLFKPYFEDIEYVRWFSDPELVVDKIHKADRVIVEAEQISLKLQAGKGEFADKVAARLRAEQERARDPDG